MVSWRRRVSGEKSKASPLKSKPQRVRHPIQEPVPPARYGGVPEAVLAKSMLDSAGIESFLGDENLVRLDWFYSNLVGGIKLMVREEDAETARALLEKNSPEER
jgi:Putative prokaryotic signal transducing protein